ncbi:iron-containing alcohol dehydrogenase [Blautia faecis]|uniref:iron-containing alcohol dehydrogenase n=1 Tax=Blautia faecis TaxID=871665 RepID=UPI0022E64018|nr:iron-containing alcohol dehydrogenase [Blautia faecis]
MINFDFFTPTKILFGAGRESEVGKQVAAFGGHKVMIIYGKKGGHIETSGLLDRVHKSLSDAGLSYVDLNGVVPNPRLSLVKEGIRIGRAEGVDFLLPIGGGSVIDTAKGIGYGIANDFEMEDLLYGRVKTDKNLPIGVILTIAAAGSEMSSSMVLTIEDGMMKRSYGHDCAHPKFAIMNPELTYSLPAYQTASGAADIMMHTMERYFTPTDTDTSLTDRIAEGLMVSVRDAAQIAVKEPENYEARATLMWAGSLSHNGLTGAGRISDFATHKIEHELGGMFDVAHGAGLAAVWGSWARYVYKTNPGRFAQFGKKVFGINISSSTNITPNSDAPEQPIKPSPIITDPELTSTDTAALAAITAWETWCHSISMPTTLTELGIHPTDTQIEEMAEKCVFGRNGHVGFFQPLTKEDIAAILKMAK